VAAGEDWWQIAQELDSVDRDALSAAQLDRLADAMFWTDRHDPSIEVRRLAYQAHSDVGDDDGAASAAWRLFYDHFLVGELAVANGWLERCRHHVGRIEAGSGAGAGQSVAAGWLMVAEADLAMAHGDDNAGLESAGRGRQVAEEAGDADLRAMALQAEGRAEIGLGRRQRGLSLLDGAMVAVINDELAPLYTGWVYCNVVSTCYGLADVRRATEWSVAAMRWCETLRSGLMYPGLCRVYDAELSWIRGAWDAAEAGARRACNDLEAFEPRYAGAAFYLVGELCRLRGDIDEAERAFARADDLGRDPQPGRALLLASQGQTADALAALRSALRPGPSAPLPRAQMLLATIEVARRAGDAAVVVEAADGMANLAVEPNPVLDAYHLLAAGLAREANGQLDEAFDRLVESVDAFDQAGLTYEAARARVAVARVAELLGDPDTAGRELALAATTFDRLGAVPDRDRVGASADRDHVGATSRRAAALTGREVEVLALVAEGLSNREIGERLVLSRHTVARHLSNIMTKLGVGSRAAATAAAYEQDLLSS
jgi:ATP/maltotriose-dependent transcriptional regulator MalT